MTLLLVIREVSENGNLIAISKIFGFFMSRALQSVGNLFLG